MIDRTILRSAVPDKTLHRMLIRSSAMGAAGIAILFYGGLIASHTTIERWGWLIFLIAAALIGLGSTAYRKLSRLARKPHEIHISGGTLIFKSGGMPLFLLDLDRVDKIEFIENKGFYGIACRLKPSTELTLLVSEKEEKLIVFNKINAKFKKDLFFPFFSRRSFKELSEILSENS